MAGLLSPSQYPASSVSVLRSPHSIPRREPDMGPHPTVAAIRLAARRVLHDVLDASTEPHPPVLAACSGGADSMALAAALAFEAPRIGVRAGGVTVDHGLQAGSALRAQEVAERMRGLGLDPVDTVGVTVGRQGGPEAAARDA